MRLALQAEGFAWAKLEIGACRRALEVFAASGHAGEEGRVKRFLGVSLADFPDEMLLLD